MPPSPLAPTAFPRLYPIEGAEWAISKAGIKYPDRPDLAVLHYPQGAQVAGVFTQSKTVGAPVSWCRQALKGGVAKLFVVNSGNANAFTGTAGFDSVRQTTREAARVFSCHENEVFVASTGVIGVPLDAYKITSKFEDLRDNLDGDVWEQAARAIMTTDTYPKGATAKAEVGDVTIHFSGIAKGSGMIAPNMATTLCFVACDAAIDAAVLQPVVTRVVDKSFNCITVDSDTSTSDTLLVAATGKAGNSAIVSQDDPRLPIFETALEEVLGDLARQVVRDGEGAKKFITISVEGAQNFMEARQVGLCVANSPLVKTAIAGEDANWGRIAAAAGRSGIAFDQTDLVISIGDVAITENGQVRPDYDEEPVTWHMKGQDIRITLDLGMGSSLATVWTCDLTHDYITINADYRT